MKVFPMDPKRAIRPLKPLPALIFAFIDRLLQVPGGRHAESGAHG